MTNPNNAKLPKARNEEEEFGGGKKGLVICKKCSNAYFKKSWRHDLEGVKEINKDLPIHFVLCPACQMIENRQYEGRITMKNVPEKIADELDKMIRHSADQAYGVDPLDRLIDIKKSGNVWVVTTTENELANKLGKKIKQTFRAKKVETRFAPEPSDVAEVTIEFE